MQLVAAPARIANVTRALDLGSGLGYSTLWIAERDQIAWFSDRNR